MAIETLSQAIDRLRADGYTGHFRALDGRLEDLDTSEFFEPGEFKVDSVSRFEGQTDADDQSAVFALSHISFELKGLYVVAFGPMMDSQDQDVVAKLNGASS